MAKPGRANGMLSTFLTYQLYSRDLPRTTERIAADPMNKRASEYYRANIQNVTSLDEFMNDYRLYSYALTAFGLEDQIESRALIRKVLESDPEDPKSLVNRLQDDRYVDLANAFDFRKADQALSIQSTDQHDLLTEAYSEARMRAAQAASAKVEHFVANISAVTNVDAFLADETLLAFALEKVDLDPSIASKSYIRDVLTGAVASDDNRYAKLVDLLPFEADGSVPSGGLMSAEAAKAVAYDYYVAMGLEATPQAAALQVEYYEARIGDVQTADDLVGDSRLLSVALTSVGLDPSIELSAFAWQMLTSDPDDPSSKLATMPEDTSEQKARKSSYMALQARFDFGPDGNAGAFGAQSEKSQALTVDGYFANYQAKAAKRDELQTTLFAAASPNITTASQFVATKVIYEYALKAFDLDPSTESKTKIVRVLRSDPSDPSSYARSLGDERYVKLAAAFNFDDAGNVSTQRIAQDPRSQIDTAERYRAWLGDDPADDILGKAEAETDDYRQALATVTSVADFVGNETIMNYVMRAYSLETERLSAADVEAILTSDLADPDSFANRSDDERYVALAAAFSFAPDGTIERSGRSVQAGAQMLSTQDLYLRQRIEEDAGQESQGVRLALFFKRSFENVSNVYDILADARLLDVVQTALGLPAASGQANIDAQARMFEKRLDMEGLKDPKQMERFISRFLALYDLQQGVSGSASPALTILGGGSMTGLL